MAIYGYTKNYKLIKPQFDTDTWHDYVYDNLDTIDAVLSAIFASGDWQGFWKSNTHYNVGGVVIDRATDTMYKVMVEHTTSEATFAEEFDAHPTYYELWSPNNLAEDWAIKMDGQVSNTDYSAKAYAISADLIDSGSAQEWAIKSGTIGDTGEYSAKKYATDAHNDYISMTTDANVVAVGTNIANVNTVSSNIADVNTTATNISSVNTVAGDISRVGLVADDISSVHTVAIDISNIIDVAANKTNIDTVAGVATDVTTVASIATAVTNVSGIESEVLDVSDNRTDISTVASNISDVNTVAGISTNVSTVAGNNANITAVAGNTTNINSVAGNETNINSVAGNATNINAVNANKTNIDTVAGDKTNIDTVAGIGSDVSTVAAIASDVSTVAGNSSNVTTVATSISDINTAAANIAAIQDAPTQASNAAASAALAQEWASKTDAQVASTDYSSKAYAQSEGLISSGSSKEWATKSATWAEGSDADVSALGGTHSAKGWADAAEDTYESVVGLIATPIGTIFQSIYVDESLDIARELNGQLISSTKFYGFREWLDDVQTSHPSLFTTEVNWQAEVTNSVLGQCGKFVIDDNAGTIRLPKVVNAQGLMDLQYLGTIKSESLPNITGALSVYWNIVGVASGSFSPASPNQQNTISGSQTTVDSAYNVVNFDASGSSSTYQNDAPVQQEAIQYPYYIQVATGVEETLPAIREYKVNNSDFFGKSMYSDVVPDNASWLASNGQYNARTVYPDYYNWLLAHVGETITANGGKVVLSTGTITDYDWVVNQNDVQTSVAEWGRGFTRNNL